MEKEGGDGCLYTNLEANNVISVINLKKKHQTEKREILGVQSTRDLTEKEAPPKDKAQSYESLGVRLMMMLSGAYVSRGNFGASGQVLMGAGFLPNEAVLTANLFVAWC